jgi:DNA-binding CsgD family transcriptional regulator
LDSKGRFLGVSGFEIGARKFARDNPLDNNNLNTTGLFFTFPATDSKQFRLNKALYTGNAILGYELSRIQEMTISENSQGLKVFKQSDNNACVGLWSDLAIYPSNSPFASNRFVTAAVISDKDFSAIVFSSRLRLILIGAILLCVGIMLSVFLSGRYEKPFNELLESMKKGDMSAKSNIQEIDDLLEFMHSQLNEHPSTENGNQESNEEQVDKTFEASTEDILDRFIENTKKLSRAEADVFNLYFEGYSAQEIGSMLNLSINTIKTHNRRIFAKLNVSSRKELQTWVNALTASGRSMNDSQQQQFDEIKNIVKNIKNSD